MKYLSLIMLSCMAAFGAHHDPVGKQYPTGLKWDLDWKKKVTFHDPMALVPAGTVLPTAVDWRTKACWPAVRDQGNCGSCYVFGTTAAMEGTLCVEKKLQLDLSEEQVLSQNSQHYDCGGGYFDVMDYFVNPGVGLEKDCPYVQTTTTCPNMSVAAKARQWLFVGNSDQDVPTDDQLRYVLQYKPLAVTVCADQRFMNYRGGVYSNPRQCGTNHIVALVGYGVDPQAGLYYILRNSWGTGWGENGYMRITPRSNNLAEAAAFVRLY